MAKKSMIARGKKVLRTISRYQETRKKLQHIIKKSKNVEEVDKAVIALQKLPRNSSSCRYVNRCRVCSRPRAFYRKVGLCRICFRENLMKGDVPGGTMSSW